MLYHFAPLSCTFYVLMYRFIWGVGGYLMKEKVELLLPPEEASVGDKLFFDGLTGGPFEPVSAAQIEKKKVLDKVLPVR